MKSVVVASANPVKIEAVRLGFTGMFPQEEFAVEGVATDSGVGEQPLGDAETRRGAENRAQVSRAVRPAADYWVGVEGGVEERDNELHAFAWVVVVPRAGEPVGRARTATFQLPPAIAALVRQGVELGHADDAVFGRNNSKQKDGAVGILTDGAIDRTSYYEHAVVLALVPFKREALFIVAGSDPAGG
jgi:inosine/xanthosine triphosphatase